MKFETVKSEVKQKCENVVETGTEFAEDHPNVVVGALSVAYLAVCTVIGIGTYKLARRDTKKMFGEILRENVVNVRSVR